jgi:membrane-associated phospholipid phosphatase
LLPGGWRAPTGVVAVLSAVGALALGWRYGGSASAGLVDIAVGDPLIEHVGGAEDVLWPVTALGGGPGLLLGVLALAWTAIRAQRWPALVLAVAGPLLAVMLTAFLLKPLVGRTHDGDLALPSGHATSVTALAWVLVLAFVAGGLPRAVWLRITLVVLAVLGVVGVSLAMVALQRHYPTDTVAGVLVGTAVVAALAWLLDGLGWPRGGQMTSGERKAGLP